MSEPNRWGIIPAAGVGRRMGETVPKQYLPLLGRKVIDHTVERLLLHPAIDGVYIALGEHDGWWDETEFAGHPDLVRAPGGKERAHSVLNALNLLAQRADPMDWVVVHDAARPCIRRGDIDRLIGCVQGHAVGGLLGVPVHDTMKRTDRDNLIRATVERGGLWHAFTPQMFRLGQLQAALQAALDAGAQVTDEASALERMGEMPLMVEGHADNIKITRPGDLEVAAFHLQQQGF